MRTFFPLVPPNRNLYNSHDRYNGSDSFVEEFICKSGSSVPGATA